MPGGHSGVARTQSPLVDAGAKLSRANFHVEALRADIAEAGQGEPYAIPLREELDKDTGMLCLRVDRDTARPEKWGVMIGDALHNFRSALDSGWWQLARHHLKREPTEEEAKKIQFPILEPGRAWKQGRFSKWVGTGAATFARELQPDPTGYPSDVFHPLDTLRRLSNIDKHRNIHTTVQRLHELRFRINGQSTEPGELDGLPGFTVHHFGARPPKAGDKVLSAPAGSILHHPKVEFDAHQTGFVAIEGGQQSVQTILGGIDEWVKRTLDGFAVLLTGETIQPFNLVLGPKRI
jgi:hypothetical protein